MEKVMLVSMPFAGHSGPSLALGQLKPILEQAGIVCDLFYGELAFREFCGEVEACDLISSHVVVGEWVFGPALFDDRFLRSKRRDAKELCKVVLQAEEREPSARALKKLDSKSKPFIERLLETVDWGGYDIVGFSTVFAQNIASLALAKAIKERWPAVTVVFGGANVFGHLGPCMMERFPFVDWVVNGEGDVAFPEAVKRRSTGEPLEGLPGLTFRRPDGRIVEQGTGTPAALDDLPLPDFDDYFRDLRARAPELESQIELPVEMSRGCWWGDHSKCIFCALTASATGCFRHKSPQRTIEEVQALVDRYQIRRLRWVDNNIPRPFYDSVFPKLAERLKLEGLFAEIMASAGRENLKTLKAAGSKVLQPGIESLDTAHLRLMKKGTTTLHNVQLLKWARELNMRITWNLLHGFPGEKAESFERMASVVPSLTHLEPPSYFMEVVLQPFSPLFEEARRYGVRNIRPNRAYSTIYPFQESELYDMVYAYQFDRAETPRLKAATERAQDRFEGWRESWKSGNPPLLGFVVCRHGRLKIHDTRPVRRAPVVELDERQSAAYLACDKRRSARAVAGLLRAAGDPVTLEQITSLLDDLVERLLMVEDGGKYVALACDLRRMQRSSASPLAGMLVEMEALAAAVAATP